MRIGIRQKIIIGFSAGVFFTILFAGWSWFAMEGLFSTTNDMSVISRKVEITGELIVSLERLLKTSSGYLISGDKKKRDEFDVVIMRINGILKEVESHKGDMEWNTAAGRVKAGILRLGDMTLEAMFMENPVGNPRSVRLMEDSTRLAEAVINDAEEFHRIAERDKKIIMERATGRMNKTRMVLYLYFMAGLGFLLLLSFYLRSYIIKPISEFHKAVEMIAGGDFSHRIEIKTNDEIGDLAKRFNEMAGALKAFYVEVERKGVEKVQELVGINKMLEELSTRDGLTGIYNHRFFYKRCDEELMRAERYKRPLSLLMVDIDDFKIYNDKYGHQKGDTILKVISECILKNLRKNDVLARYGGEEFGMILPETGREMALTVAERIREKIEEECSKELDIEPEDRLTVSIGVASYPLDSTTINGLVKTADSALYRAKGAGKNKVVSVEPQSLV